MNVEIETGDATTLMSGARDGSIDMCLLQSTTGASPTYLMMAYVTDGVTYCRVQDPKYYDLHVAVNQCVDKDDRIKKGLGDAESPL